MRDLPKMTLSNPRDGVDPEKGVDAARSRVRFYEEVGVIENAMKVTERVLMKLQDTIEESKSIRNPPALKALRDRMDQEVKEVSKAAQSIHEKLEQLGKANGQRKDCEEKSPTDPNTAKIMISLRKRLKEMRSVVDSLGRVDMLGVDAAEGSISQLVSVPHKFTYNELSVATRGFCEELKLGNGGFGNVYRGELPLGTLVAVKKMNRGPAQRQGMKEFRSEVSIISLLWHRNLIELLGWCEDSAKMEYMLVYELMNNGSLDNVLFNPAEGKTCLSWSQRFKIVTGIAAALDYLHQGCKKQVIHRDIKCSNIMLDEEWNAKLGDFGIARLADHDGEADTTNMAGTFGYIAPEIFIEGRFTAKTDVFAFGVVVLEVACGRRVLSRGSQETGLVGWVRQSLNEDELLSTVDKRLKDYDPYLMKLMLMIGLACCHPNPRERPSMRKIVQMLIEDSHDELMKMIVRVKGEETSNSISGHSPSNSSEEEHDNYNHSCTNILWRQFMSAKKISLPSVRLSDRHAGKRNRWLPFRKGDPMIQLEGTPSGILERFNHKQLSTATGAFSEKSKIGEGWFGSVYRGELRSGISVAVKTMNGHFTQRRNRKAILAELSLLSQLKHPNLIQLLGWCEYGARKKYILVYELIANGSLENVFLQAGEEMPGPSWQQRFNMVIGIATAVDYLHNGWNQKVIHRNITHSSIMVDEEWNAKLGSFDFAVVPGDHQVEVEFVGTLGFIAPEDTAYGTLTDKADVFSFGVVVLEVACGRKVISHGLPQDEVFLVGWVRRSLSEGELLKVVDKRLAEYDTHRMEVLLIVGLLCSQDDRLARPPMTQVLQMLAGNVPVPSISKTQKLFCSTDLITRSNFDSDSDSA